MRGIRNSISQLAKLKAIPRSIANVLQSTLTSLAASQAALAALPVAPQAALPQLTECQSALVGPPLEIEDIAAVIELAKPQTSMLSDDIASEYISLIGTGKKDDADTTFGLRTKPDQSGMFYIGTKPVQIAGNELIIDDKKYEGTKGLWELIVSNEPDETHITDSDKAKYEAIMITTIL
jgi:hypothetical protein